MNKIIRKSILVAVALSAAAFQAPVTYAQAVLEEIVVTAAYREQGLQEVPVSISAVTGDTMAAAAIQKAEDIQFLVPNFTLTETGIGTNAFIRGIGSGINQAFEQSVGTYVDGVHQGRAQQFRSPFLDIERVEVLRGPQSILFGKNSVAGALNITTAKPTDEFEGRFMASNEFENNELILEGMLSGALSDTVRARIAVRTRDLDGHMENITLSRDEPEREDWTVRGTLEFDLSDTLTATLKAEIGEFDVFGRHIEVVNELPAIGGPFMGLEYNQILAIFTPPGSGIDNVVQDEIRSSNGDFSNNEVATYALTLDWEIGEYNLESISALSTLEYDEFCDCDFTGSNVFGAALQEEYDQFSQELRLSSPLREDYDYILGLYYQTSDHDYDDQIIIEPTSILVPVINAQSPGSGDAVAGTQAVRDASVEADVISAFAQFNWHFNDNFTLQLGARVTKDEREGFRTLNALGLDGNPLPAAQVAAPLVLASLFDITSEELIALTQSPVPQLSLPANALAYGVMLSDLMTPCTSTDAANCTRGLGVLPVSGDRDETKVSPEIKLVWDQSDDTMLYFSWAEGFKSGSYDFRANNRSTFPTMSDSFEFDDEEASNFELGGKFTLGGGAFELNAALFFTDFQDLQVSIFDGTLGFNVRNAAEAEVQGAEFDWRWAASDHLMITGGIAFTDFEFKDFPDGQAYFLADDPDCVDISGEGIVDLCPYTGKSNQMVSDIQGNISFQYSRPVSDNLEFIGMLDVFYTSEYDASATFDPALVQDGYSMINARIGVGSLTGGWQLALLGKNLSDEKVLSFGGDVPLSGTSFLAKSNYAFFNPGRTVTLQASIDF